MTWIAAWHPAAPRRGSAPGRAAAAVTVALLGSPAPGGVVEFDDKEAWTGTVGAFVTLDFAGFPTGTHITDQYAGLGVLFTDGNNAIDPYDPVVYPNDGAGLFSIPSISVQFTTPQSWIAVEYPGPIEICLFRRGELIFATYGNDPVPYGNFAGLVSTQFFDAAVISRSPDHAAFLPIQIDDLHFGVPAPAVSWLLVALLLLPRRGRQSRSRADHSRAGAWSPRALAATAATGLLGPAGTALAGVTEFTERQAWFDAVDEVVTTIGFAEYTCGTIVTDQYEDLGVVLLDGDDFVICCGHLCPDDGAGVADDGPISVAFTTPEPQTAIAVDFVQYVVISLFASGELIYTSNGFSGQGGAFAGLTSTQPFDTAVFSDPTDGGTIIGDLHYVAGALTPCADATACEADKLLAFDGRSHDYLASAVSAWGDVVVAGAPGDDSIVGADAGSVYVFRSGDGLQWAFEQKLAAQDGADLDQLGHGVAVAGNILAVGAPFHDEATTNAGAVYVFHNTKGPWLVEQKLLAPDAQPYDDLGWAVAMDPGPPPRIVASAAFDDDNGFDSGSVYVFRFDEGTGWVPEQKLLADDGGPLDNFGISVAIDAGQPLRIIAGAYNDDDNGFDSGSAYVFRFDVSTSTWQQEGKLLAADGQPEDQFGIAVSASGGAALVGAAWSDDNGNNSGSAYVFRFDEMAASWRQEQKLLAADGQAADQFGISVALDGTLAVIGGHLDDDGMTDAGAVYIFGLEQSGWAEQQEVLASDGFTFDLFGRTVATWQDGSARRIAVGAPWDDPTPSIAFAGAVYVFNLSPAGDLDCDGLATVSDLLAILSSWGSCAVQEDCPPDLNCDGTVGIADLLMLLGNWN